MNRSDPTIGQRRFGGFAGGLLFAHALLVGWISFRTSPTIDEVGHLPAGIYSWEFGRFDVYRVNPPLVRTLAALPVVLSGPELQWTKYSEGPRARPEWNLGRELVEVNDRGDGRWFWYFVIARWMCIPLSLLGGYVCWRWAGELYGPAAGLLALALWCFCPNVMAWAATICPDAGAAAVGGAAAYLYWRWLDGPTWSRALAAGAVLGLALLTKTTWVILLGVWPVLWVVWHWGEVNRQKGQEAKLARGGRTPERRRQTLSATAGQLGLVLLTGVYVLNLGYAFEGTFKPLGKYTFVSRTLAGDDSVPDGGTGGNRFAAPWVGAVPMPVPENFLRGIDLQKVDFEVGRNSYLCGEWKQGGWWYYYLVVALLKVPLGTWLLGAMAVGLTLPARGGRGDAGDYSSGWRSELVVLLPAVAVFVLVSSQTGFSRYFRYVLPCFPFVFIWVSKVGCQAYLRDRGFRVVAGIALLWSAASSLSIYPHSLSYFNEAAGGPRLGHRYLLDANIDWGQDLLYLKRWLDAHPEVSLVDMDCYSFLAARHFGIETGDGPTDRDAKNQEALTAGNPGSPRWGWHAISVHRLFGASGKHQAFQGFEPAAMAGYSIYLYHLAAEEAANPVGEETGGPPSPF